MVTFRKLGTRYQAQVRRHGYPTISRSFSKLSDAKEWARLKEREADRLELPEDRNALRGMMLAELVKRYRDEVVPNKKGGEIERITLNAFLRLPICNKKLSELTSADFLAYRDKRLETVSASTLKRQLNTIRHMFRHARSKWGIPVSGDLLAKVRLKGADNRRERRLGSDELMALLLGTAKCRNPYVRPVIELALETAMRRGEILSLQWGHIDLERGSLTVVESKNGHSRIIPLTNAASDTLKAVERLNADNDLDDGRVLPITPEAFKQAWQKLAARVGIDDLHFHDLRHEAISRLFEKGLTVPEVASISGHRDMRMLFRYALANHALVRQKLEIGLERQ